MAFSCYSWALPHRWRQMWSSLGLCLLFVALGASEVLSVAQVPGGLAVVLGCGNGALARQIATADPRFIVHGLDADATAIAAARTQLLADRLYGQVTVECWNSDTLPYADQTVNLLVVEKPTDVAPAELMRVLSPKGVLCQREGDVWVTTIKPRPSGMDDWPQWRHGPDRNPVSNDQLVDVPRRIQWLSYHGEESTRMVVADGRYVVMISGVLHARDAFNGLPVWRYQNKLDAKFRPLATSYGIFVVDDGKLICLDAATGLVKQQYPQAGTPKMVVHVPGNDAGRLVSTDDTTMRMIEVASGTQVWSRAFTFPRAVSIRAGTIFLISGNTTNTVADLSTVMAVDLAAGTDRWARSDLTWAKSCYRSCAGNGVVAFETGRFAIDKPLTGDSTAVDGVHFLDATTGAVLRDHNYVAAMRHDNNARAFFVGDRAILHQREVGANPTTFAIFDDVRQPPRIQPTAHPKSTPLYCFPPVATTRFFIYGELGFTDWNTFAHVANPLTRGSCGRDTEGLIPANGLLYVFQKSCNCFSMMHGVAALAPSSTSTPVPSNPLVTGAAYAASVPVVAQADEWPMYRHDGYRTGSTQITVPSDLGTLWSTTVSAPAYAGPALAEWNQNPFTPGPLTPPVIAQGLVFTAQPHTHRVHAFDAATGAARWSFTANGRIDSAPTVAAGRVLFGSRSGWLFCLRASDGELIWSRRLAPDDRRIVHCGQVESTSPVPGSVLVDQGIAYVSAGIHPLADAQVQVFAIRIDDGSVVWQRTVSRMGYEENGWRNRNGLEQDYMDMLVKDGADRVSLSRWVFDPANGDHVFKWHNAFYRVGADGAFVPRGSWSYGNPMNRLRMDRPLVVARAGALFGADKVRTTTTVGPRLFRRDFPVDENFDVQWDEKTSDTDSRTGVYHPVNRAALAATWTAPYPGWVQALVLAGWSTLVSGVDDQSLTLGVWGRRITQDQPLREGDRLEVYRSLRVDPKVARRERFVGQGARGTGLFARRKPGSKAGY